MITNAYLFHICTCLRPHLLCLSMPVPRSIILLQPLKTNHTVHFALAPTYLPFVSWSRIQNNGVRLCIRTDFVSIVLGTIRYLLVILAISVKENTIIASATVDKIVTLQVNLVILPVQFNRAIALHLVNLLLLPQLLPTLVITQQTLPPC